MDQRTIDQLIECVLPIDPKRTGECINCGRCCINESGIRCIFYDGKCTIYSIRPPQCVKSPRTIKFLREGCPGYQFPEGSTGVLTDDEKLRALVIWLIIIVIFKGLIDSVRR